MITKIRIFYRGILQACIYFVECRVEDSLTKMRIPWFSKPAYSVPYAWYVTPILFLVYACRRLNRFSFFISAKKRQKYTKPGTLLSFQWWCIAVHLRSKRIFGFNKIINGYVGSEHIPKQFMFFHVETKHIEKYSDGKHVNQRYYSRGFSTDYDEALNKTFGEFFERAPLFYFSVKKMKQASISEKGLQYSYRDRKNRKRNFCTIALITVRISGN